jgi:hypothetical protein
LFLSRHHTKKKKQVQKFLLSSFNKDRYRHLMTDFKKMIPHHRADVKMDSKVISFFVLLNFNSFFLLHSILIQDNLRIINEICEMKSCNKCLFFEVIKKERESVCVCVFVWLQE